MFENAGGRDKIREICCCANEAGTRASAARTISLQTPAAYFTREQARHSALSGTAPRHRQPGPLKTLRRNGTHEPSRLGRFGAEDRGTPLQVCADIPQAFGSGRVLWRCQLQPRFDHRTGHERRRYLRRMPMLTIAGSGGAYVLATAKWGTLPNAMKLLEIARGLRAKGVGGFGPVVRSRRSGKRLTT